MTPSILFLALHLLTGTQILPHTHNLHFFKHAILIETEAWLVGLGMTQSIIEVQMEPLSCH